MKKKILLFLTLCSGAVAMAQTCVNSTNQIGNTSFSWNGFNQGFTSGLTKSASCTSGTYLVGTGITSKCATWSPNFSDHTTGSGNFLIVSGHQTTSTDAWRYGVNIIPYTTYTFSFWARSIHNSNTLELQFIINGNIVATTPSISYGAWTQYSTTWNSGTFAGSVTVAIRQKTVGANKNFGLDDIVFSSCDDEVLGCDGAAYNLVQNPAFSSGDTGFTSAFPDSVRCLHSTYYVSTQLVNKCDRWADLNFTDHTTGTGNFLIVDGSEDMPSNIWNQNVTITPYTDYTFSFWARSLYTEAFKVEFLVGGYSLGESQNILSGQWCKYSVTWNSAWANGSLPITLRQTSPGQKRDLGIDDIFFGYCYYPFANTTNLANTDAASEITLFPNPSNGAFTLTTASEYEKNIFVYDIVGKVVLEKTNNKEKSTNIDISHLSKGIYTVKVIHGNNCQVKKMVIE